MRYRCLLLSLSCVTILACDSSQPPVTAPVTSGTPAPLPAPVPASPVGNPQANSTAASPSAPAPQANSGRPPGAVTTTKPYGGYLPPGGESAAAESVENFPVKLSNGVQLDQEGPGGSVFLFKVDYEFVSQAPDASKKYELVILAKSGRAILATVELESKGSLESLGLTLRPADGPFEAGLTELGPDRKPKFISNTIPLKAP